MFTSCCVGHELSIESFKNYWPWCLTSWNVLLSQKPSSWQLQNWLDSYLSNTWIFWIRYRSRKEFLEQDPTTLKVWSVWLSTGSHREMVFYSRPSLEMSRRTVGSITLLQARFSVQPVLTGMSPGELPLPFKSLFWYAACVCSVREGLKNDEITVAGDQWPLLVYADCAYDPEEPWEGLFRNKLLVWVLPLPSIFKYSVNWQTYNFQAFKHIFTSPSSVDLDPKATRSGNARIHGMTRVTTASLAYVATQVRP